MSENKSYVLAVTCIPENYQTAGPVPQSEVDFNLLYKTLTDIFWVENYDLTLQIPDFFMDLKATSTLRRQSESGLTDHLKALEGPLLAGAIEAGHVFKSETCDELNGELNDYNHCPAVFLMVVTGTPANFLKWNNERMGDGFSFGESKSTPFAASFPQNCLDQLQTVFSDVVTYQKLFFLNPTDTQPYACMLKDEIRKQMSGRDQKKFDKKMEKMHRKAEQQSKKSA